VKYGFYGVHDIESGKIGLYGLPEGLNIDIRELPRLWKEEEDKTVVREIVKAELEKELRKQKESLLLSDVPTEGVLELVIQECGTDVGTADDTPTRCPLIIQLQIPPIPRGLSFEEIQLYESELHDPTGIRMSLARPPRYWEASPGIGGVIIADGCGWAYGVSGGTGVAIDDFWRKSLNCEEQLTHLIKLTWLWVDAAFATLSQLLVLFLLVRQMESTRTPSTLSKVSLWTIAIMGVADSWIFSAHVIMGIMAENKGGITMLVPGFLSLCCAVVFGPVSSRPVIAVLADGWYENSDMRFCCIGSKHPNEHRYLHLLDQLALLVRHKRSPDPMVKLYH
jgi:hypothetical protein